MNTIFIGGSRHVSRLPSEIKKRLDNVVASGHRVIVGDASGADKAVQKHLLDKHYDKVTVFCSGSTPRNNLGTWRIHHVDVPKSTRGFHFYAAKDREMAREADFGLMIWDGKSPGTILNVLRLALAGKIAVLFDVPRKDVVNIRTLENWRSFISQCSRELQSNVKERATPEECRLIEFSDKPTLLTLFDEERAGSFEGGPTPPHSDLPSDERRTSNSLIKALNHALAQADANAFMNALGTIAREQGMTHVARETGLARESLYRSLDVKGNPEFSTVLKVLFSIGLRLEAKPDGNPRRARAKPRKSLQD